MNPMRIEIGSEIFQLPREVDRVPEEHVVKIFAATTQRDRARPRGRPADSVAKARRTWSDVSQPDC